MTRTTIPLLIIVHLLYTAVVGQDVFSGGSGTAEAPFLISTAKQLAELQKFTGKEHRGTYFKITTDISLGTAPFDSGWKPIGFFVNDTVGSAFEGILDGNGKTIKNLIVNDTTQSTGLFGYCKGTLHDILLDSVNVTGLNYVGALCGIIDSGVVEQCGSTNGTVSGAHKVGGLIGECRTTNTLKSSSSKMRILHYRSNWSAYAGGFVGSCVRSTISECHAACSLSTLGTYSGGFVGNSNNSTITTSSAEATINGASSSGGFVGENISSSFFLCTASGKVVGTDNCGGFAGSSHTGRIDSCSADATVAGTSQCGGLVGFSTNPISRCSATGTVEGTVAIGGIAGHSADSITSSHFSGTVKGDENCGGMCGLNSGRVQFSSATGAVTGKNRTGGFAGLTNVDISDCFTNAVVTGKTSTGGFAGRNEVNILRCYSTGSVTGRVITGGFVGSAELGHIQCCFSTGEIHSLDSVGGFAGICNKITNCYSTGTVDAGCSTQGGFTGGTTYYAKNICCYATGRLPRTPTRPCTLYTAAKFDSCYYSDGSSFICNKNSATMLTLDAMGRQSSYNGWDFDSVWTIEEGITYPYFRWQHGPVAQNYLSGSTPLSHASYRHTSLCNPIDGNSIRIQDGSYSVLLYSLAGRLISSCAGQGPAVISISRMLTVQDSVVIVAVSQSGRRTTIARLMR